MLGCHSAVALNRILKTLGWKSKRDTDAPTKKATQAGWLAVRMRQRSGCFRSFPQVFVTPKGIDELRRIFGSKPTGLYVRGRCSMNSARSSIPRSASRFALGVP